MTHVCASASRSFFFLSSRRRHTRFKCDWSSDVCSSDLVCVCVLVSPCMWCVCVCVGVTMHVVCVCVCWCHHACGVCVCVLVSPCKIGRASWRERVYIAV